MNGYLRVVTLTLLAAAMSAASVAQLDLPPRAPRPAFDTQDSPFVRLMGRLRSEVRPIDWDGIEEADASSVATAVSTMWRLLALAMLERGLHAGPQADQIVLSGMQMAMSRTTLDALLVEKEENPLVEDERLIAFLELAESALEHGLPALPAEARSALFEIAAPLRELLEDHREISAPLWPTVATSLRTPVAAEDGSKALVRQRMSELERVARESGLAERHALREKYAARTGELRPLAVAAAEHAKHGTPAERAVYARRVEGLAADLARSEAALKALAAVKENAAQRTLREVLLELEAAAPDLWSAEETRVRRAWRQRMDWFIAAASALPERPDIGQPPRLFAPVARQLERAGRLSERTTLDALERLAAEPDAWTDPGVVSGLCAVDEHRQDLLRLPAMATWPDRVGELDAEAGRRVANWLRQWTEQLADPMRRDQARSRIVQMEREFALQDAFARLLEPGDDVATENLLGGRPKEVREVVREQQRAWAKAWGTGTPEAERTYRLEDFAFLATVVNDGTNVLTRDHRTSPLSVWPGWEMVPVVLGRLSNMLPIRVRLASTELAKRDFAALRGECRVIDHELSVVRLVVALNRDLAPDMAPDPEDPFGVLLRPLTPPPGTARWAAHLPALATVCRYIFESEFARAARRTEDAEAAWQYAARIAREVLERN